MRMVELIQKKKEGSSLTEEEIRFFVQGYTKGDIPDYQASAFAMAIYFQGMNDEEIVSLTKEMAKSGDVLDLSKFGNLSVDKHSTGGVGDKTSLVVTPIVASLGAKVTKMSGRGLGHTGGTVDKLESIPGFCTSLTEEKFLKQIEDIGIAVIGQTGNLTPADKKLYALRDVTATVDSIPLITSSIMSKKLAAGSHSIVLDVKVGKGAFMKQVEDARKLAQKMVTIGKNCGRNMCAVLTDMESPLGFAIGNSLEVKEAIAVLKGEEEGDLFDVSVVLASEMISLAFNINIEEAKVRVLNSIRTGKAFETMIRWISAQGGDASYIIHPERFPEAKLSQEIRASQSGFLSAMDAEKIGLASVYLGAGRSKKEDTIDHSAGILLHHKVGEFVHCGETIATIFGNKENSFSQAEDLFYQAININQTKIERRPLIFDIIR